MTKLAFLSLLAALTSAGVASAAAPQCYSCEATGSSNDVKNEPLYMQAQDTDLASAKEEALNECNQDATKCKLSQCGVVQIAAGHTCGENNYDVDPTNDGRGGGCINGGQLGLCPANDGSLCCN